MVSWRNISISLICLNHGTYTLDAGSEDWRFQPYRKNHKLVAYPGKLVLDAKEFVLPDQRDAKTTGEKSPIAFIIRMAMVWRFPLGAPHARSLRRGLCSADRTRNPAGTLVQWNQAITVNLLSEGNLQEYGVTRMGNLV
jgi:hypothetical protein